MYKTKAIILKSIKYGETSLVVTAFTELFGVQTYMVNGVRTTKKTGVKAMLYQPASVVEMEVYHNDRNSMHRIKECNRTHVFNQVLTDVVKNSIAAFLMELLYKLLKQPEQNTDLFYFCEDALLQIDAAPTDVVANFPLFLALHLSHFFGFKIDDNFTETTCFLDLQEGMFADDRPHHPYYLEKDIAQPTSEILKTQHPSKLVQIKIPHAKRRLLLTKLMEYYSLHVQDFGTMKTVLIMQTVLG
ncbi:DNA repair protein RecO [Ferruginibacter yonginensis]|uniref:DNA repair protein RecO n=1 Tax=Ferruginibacter yonginensis TaxID=1310416 RepID=A0ABV8QSZ7_9BACT